MNQIKKKNKNITNETIKGIIWMFLGTGGQNLVQILVLIILARLLSPEDFGVVNAALIVIGFSSIFSMVGIGPAITQRSKITEQHLKTGFTISILFGVLVSFFICILSPTIANFFKIEELKLILPILSFIFIFQSLSIVGESLLQRKLKFKRIAVIEFGSYTFGYGFVGVTLAYFQFNIWSLVFAQISYILIKCIWINIIQSYPKKIQLNYKAAKDLIYFGGGFTLGRISNYFALQGDNIVTGRWLGPEALGLYGRAYQLMAMPAILFGQVLDKVLFPSMSKVQNEIEILSNYYRKGVTLSALLSFPVTIVLFYLSEELVLILLGKNWLDMVLPFKILAFGIILRTSYKISDSLARACGAVYLRAWRQVVYACSVFLLSWIGHHWGLQGVAVGVLISLVINYLLMADLSLKLVRLSWKDFVLMHLNSVKVGIITYIIITFMDKVIFQLFYNVPPIVTIIVEAFFTMVILIILILKYPRILVGSEGVWFIQTLLNFIKKKAN